METKMKNYNVGIIGATGMVGQRFAVLLENHPLFPVSCHSTSLLHGYRKQLQNHFCRLPLFFPVCPYCHSRNYHCRTQNNT